MYAGRYEPLCAAVALMYSPVGKDLFNWTPRQVKSLDKARRKPWPVAEEEDLARRNTSHWCSCTVTSSEGAWYFKIR